MLFNKKASPRQQRNGYERKSPQTRSSRVSWKRCCFGACSISNATRFVVCLQILSSLGLLFGTIFDDANRHEMELITDIFLISVITHASLAFVCAVLVFVALHFRLAWLIVLELIFLVLAIVQHLASSVVFQIYVLKNALRWLNGQNRCNLAEGISCHQISQEEWPKFVWPNLYLAVAYLISAVLGMFWFIVVLKCFYYLRTKCQTERRRRRKAQESMGLLADGGGSHLASSCGVGRHSNTTHSRSTLTTSLTATTYDHSTTRDPDLRY